jgi:oxygen-independent coproporphyrinogen-3 oxidase
VETRRSTYASIAAAGALARKLGLSRQTVYFGGGTPPTLCANELSQLFDAIACAFDLSGVLEYCVEAGRPDTIDEERLRAMAAAGVTRLSVNPQTMSDEILAAVGRNHTAEDVRRAFSLSRSLGFDCINMDLIAGLPGDTPEGFMRSISEVIALGPENVTVHALTVKRASAFAAQDALALYQKRTDVEKMIDGGRAALRESGYAPYYLYRQKNTVGNLDNTGYTLPGREGLYNVFIMDEVRPSLPWVQAA